MIDVLMLFIALMSGGLLIVGAVGFVVDKLSGCKWVHKLTERMIKG